MEKNKDEFLNWGASYKHRKWYLTALMIFALIAAPLPIAAGVISFIMNCSFLAAFTKPWLYGAWLAVEAAILFVFLFDLKVRGSKRVLKVNDNLEDSHFLTMNEMEKNAGFTVTKFSELGTVGDGVPIIVRRAGNDMEIVLMNTIHAMLIATTGTGKSTAYISPAIEILSRTKTKPCFVITDPKGELYETHAATLKRNGYNVHIVDMERTYESTLWNPFNDVIRKTEKASAPINRVKNRYVWGDRTFPTYAEAEKARKEYTIQLNDEVQVDLRDLIYTMCTVDTGESKSWQEGARDLILAMVTRMWEDFRDNELPKEKFNIYNLWWNLTEYATQESIEILKEYICDCADTYSRAKGLANTVLVSQDRTLTSYLGSVNQYLHWMADGGVAHLTHGNELEFGEWDEGPNALFVIVPEAKDGRYGFISLMLVQIYKALLEKAGINNQLEQVAKKSLKRPCYFLMDEFGLLPKIHRFEKIVQIARSHKMFFVPVLQDFNQLTSVYGQTDATTIRSNMPIKIFMGTDDQKTLDEISTACGKHKVRSVSYSESKDMNVSTSAQSLPLIYPGTLKKLNDPKAGRFGNSVICDVNHFPIQGKIAPIFETKDLYGISDEKPPKKPFNRFDELENRFDIKKYCYYLNCDDEEIGEQKVDEEVTQASAEIIEQSLNSEAKSRLKKQIEADIKNLQSHLSEEDFIRLGIADTRNKIMILDELAEQAMIRGDIFLSMSIDKLIVILHSCERLESGDDSTAGNGQVTGSARI